MTITVDRQEKPKLGLDRDAEMRLKNNRLGMNIFQASWIMVFFAMIVVNWQLRFSYAQWPPAGVAPFDPLLPSIATLALLLSAALVRRAWQRLAAEQLSGFLPSWRAAMALGLVFVIIILYEFAAVSEAALATQYGVTLRLMTGFHVVHALAILVILLWVYRKGAARAFSGRPHDSWAVEGTAKLWYFVTVAWLLFYVVLYWIH